MEQFWLLKSEPSTYSIGDLERDGSTLWEGVRNYQARNFMRDQMRVGDRVLFYHSSAEPSAVAGLARVQSCAKVDPTQFQAKSKYFDSKATKDNPIWFCPEIKFERKFKKLIAIEELRKIKKLASMELLKRGSRLSVQPVTKVEFETILAMDI